MSSIVGQLRERFCEALAAVLGEQGRAADPLIRPTQEPRFGDYQSNCAMGLAKETGWSPKEVADRLVRALRVGDICESVEVAGAGFINLRLKRSFLAGSLEAIQADPRLGLAQAARRQRVVVDYSGPNVAKLMHVGHLRSTIIGDCLVRMLEFAGHQVIRRNHIGDWGLQMGMVLYATRGLLDELERAAAQPGKQPSIVEALADRLEQIEQAYGRVSEEFARAETSTVDGCRDQLRRLQSDDPQARQHWQWLRQATLKACQRIYDRLGVKLRPEDVQGESAYKDQFEPMLAELKARGLIEESQGALCAFLRDEAGQPIFRSKDGQPLPLIVQKSDGTYLYATFDLAALRYRGRTFKPDRIIYVHDARQSQHFEMVFECARQAGFVGPDVRLEFVPFGTVLGADRRPFRTRAGQTVRLEELLDEAEQRARAIVDANSPELPESQRAEIATRVGIGAVKYNDLVHNIASDYVFSWDKMLAMDGNTAPYMMYAYARVQSIARKGGLDYRQLDPRTRIVLEHESEVALAKKLLQFADVLPVASGEEPVGPASSAGEPAPRPAPHLLTNYLFETSQAFSAFYRNCPVLRAADCQLRNSRLRLCDLAARTLKTGLQLLGIETLDRM